ncbi:MAG: hypothetical protein ACP6IS_07150 [Candidatus Asgardarchaeia archaeon]
MNLISKRIIKKKELLLVLIFEFIIFVGLTLIAAQQSTYQPTKTIEINVRTEGYFNYMGWNGENIVLLQTNYVGNNQYHFIVEIDENGEIISNSSLPIENIEWISGFYATSDSYYILGENESANLIEIIVFSKDLQVIDSYNITSILGKGVHVSTIAYNGSAYWVVENLYGYSKVYLLEIDVEQNELISNITLPPPNNTQVFEYYVSGIAYGRNSLWVVDSLNMLFRVFPNKTITPIMNITEAILPYFADKNITDFYASSIAISEDTLWISVYYYSSELQGEKTVIFGFDLNEIAPQPASENEGVEQFTPENERVENAKSSATQSVVSGLVAAATTTIAASSVSTVSAMTTTTVSTTTTTAATTGAATGAQTARENILTQLKNLFSLRKLKNLFKKKKEEEKEELVKPNFALATGVITLLGAIIGAAVAVVLYGPGNIGALLNGIATGVGLPLSVFGLITGAFTFSLIIRKKIEAKTFTKIATIISIIASVYGLITAPLALATMYPFEVTALYGGFAVVFAGYLAAIQISDFIRALATMLNR